MATAVEKLDKIVPEATVLPTRPEIVPLDKVVAEVKQDAAQEPGKYLDESVSPQGGE